MKRKLTTHLVKMTDQGLITIAIPRLAGQYVVVEQKDSQVVIAPLDLESDSPGAAVARQGANFTLLGSQARALPEA
jgi:hypothetical protein